MTSTLSFTNSAKTIGRRSMSPAAPRRSTTTFCPSIQPVLASSPEKLLPRKDDGTIQSQEANLGRFPRLLRLDGERRGEEHRTRASQKRAPL
jgi:hypothetical protein